ncbi:MAG TPA: urease accessory protein UreD, partial [Vicinamibacterales bacterium]|nr:urease accessory protein UreD [Vicinamibacterales bacterium]
MLTRSYAEPPFRVGPAIDVDGAAYLIVVCAGPGVFGGDDLSQSIHVGRGARVILTSQSALQVHPSLDPSTAAVRQRYRVDEDG